MLERYAGRSVVALAAVCAALVAACGAGDDAGEGTAPAASGPQPVKTGLILDAPKNAIAWTRAAVAAAETLEDEGLIELQVVDNVAPDATGLKRVATQMAEDGVELIIAHSGTWGEAVGEVAQDYPDANFAFTGADPTGANSENVAAITFPMYQGAYLAGVLAGGVTETGVIGGTAGFDIPVCHAMLHSFAQGAESIRPGIKMLPSYVGSWTDQEKIKEAVLASADQQADVFVPCGTDPGTIAGAKERDVSVFGYVVDEAGEAPRNVMASLVWKLEIPFRAVVDDLRRDRFRPGKTYAGGVPEGAIELVMNPEFSRRIPEQALSAFRKARAAMESGELEVPFVGGQ